MKSDINVFKGESRVGSFFISQGFGRPHESIKQLIEKYRETFEEFSDLHTKKMDSTGGRPATEYMLTHDQTLFLLSLLRNTEQIIEVKATVIKTRNVLSAIDSLRNFDTDGINVRFVYAVVDDSGFVKIGITSDIERRISELQAANGSKIELVMSKRADLPGYQSEICLHEKCRKFRIHNEWFSNDALKVIKNEKWTV
jgi:hypothetical protein